MEEWTENPTIKTERGDLSLSTVGIAALRRLTSLISDIPEVRDACSPKEIAEEVFERYSTLVLSTRQPSGQEFTDDVLRALRAKVKVHELLIAIEGIDIVDQEAIDLGSMRICKADRRLLEGVKLGGILTPDWVYGLFQDKLWLRSFSSLVLTNLIAHPACQATNRVTPYGRTTSFSGRGDLFRITLVQVLRQRTDTSRWRLAAHARLNPPAVFVAFDGRELMAAASGLLIGLA